MATLFFLLSVNDIMRVKLNMKSIRGIFMKNKTSVTLYYLILIILYRVDIIKFLDSESS